jgi:hypothetical protein
MIQTKQALHSKSSGECDEKLQLYTTKSMATGSSCVLDKRERQNICCFTTPQKVIEQFERCFCSLNGTGNGATNK